MAEVEELTTKINVQVVSGDSVNHPPHYNQGKIEVIDFIEDQKLNFSLGSAVKYVCRNKHKGKPIEDLKKSLWYIQREITRLELEEKEESEEDERRKNNE